MAAAAAVEPKKVVLLGAGGFIGCHMTERLIKNGVHTVVAVDITPEKIAHVLSASEGNPKLRYEHVNILTDKAAVERLVAEGDIIVDLIAVANPSLYVTSPLEVFTLNFTANLEIVELCHKHKKRLIQFSTCEVYGVTAASCVGKSAIELPCTFSEDETPLIMGPVKNQRWIYACAKQLLERVLHAYGIEHGFNYTIIRPFNFVGPRIDYLPSEQDGNPRVFSHFMNALLYGTPMRLVDGGTNLRGYTYIDDAIDCIMLIVDNPNNVCNQQIYNIGHPENELSIRDMAFRMREMFNKEFRQPGDPENVEIVDVSAEEFYGKGYEDCDRRIADISKAKDHLGWVPQIDLENVIRKTMAFFVKEHRDKQAAGKIPAVPAPIAPAVAAAAAAAPKSPPAKRAKLENSEVGVGAVRV